MNIQAEKKSIIEALVNINDEELILKIKSLLKIAKPVTVPMTLDEFYAKIEASEKAYAQGEVVSQSVLEKEIINWKRRK